MKPVLDTQRILGQRPPLHGFTLVELLVVITLIVILLAMLTPALDRAIYEAELAACAAQLRAIGTSAATYALGHKRSYPYRVGARNSDWSEANLIRNANPFSFGSNWDERPVLREALDLSLLVCPLVAKVDLDTQRPDTLMVLSSYAIRFDWGFTGFARMARLGQSWTLKNDDGTHRFSILAHDFATSGEDEVRAAWGTHPDRDGMLRNTALQDELINLTAPIRVTGSRWDGPLERGTVDLNFAYDDGAVLRVRDIGWDHRDDERITPVPEYDAADARPLWHHLMPIR